MKIAPQHVPGTDAHKLSALMGLETPYEPSCAWPEDCRVQWGHGIVPATPFFEAFPAGSFIRGEGATIAEAEAKAFADYQRTIGCDHVWGRHRPGTTTTYTNGAAFCRKCGGFKASMVPPLRASGWWRKPLSRMERDHLRSMEEDHDLNEIMDRKYPDDKEGRAKSKRILRLRLNVFGCDETNTSWS
jgi:hypothetical protein